MIKLIQQNNYFVPQLGNLRISEIQLDSCELEKVKLEPILFQAGYLTVLSREEARRGGIEYVLGFPNKEVQLSFNDMLIDYFTDQPVELTRYQTG